MKKLFLLISTTILFYSCSSTHMINRNYPAYKELNDNLEGEECEITLTDGQIYVGSDIEIKRDSILWYDSNNPNNIFIQPTSDIHRIMYIDRLLGMGVGIGFGSLFGMAMGGLIGNCFEKSEPKDRTKNSFMDLDNIGPSAGVIGLVIGVSSGVLIGGSYGVIRGERKIFILNPLINLFQTPNIPKIPLTPITLNSPITPIAPIAPTKIKNINGKIRLLEIKKIINETEQSITVLWGIKEVRLPKFDIIEIIEKDATYYFRIYDEIFKKYFK